MLALRVETAPGRGSTFFFHFLLKPKVLRILRAHEMVSYGSASRSYYD